jgi:pyruvate dehydrogenase (quinone)
MAKRVADLLTEVLADAGVRRIYGVSGDSLNGIIDSVPQRGDTKWVHLRHEDTAAFAARADAHTSGTSAVLVSVKH